MATEGITSKLNSLHYPLKIDGKDMEKEILKPFKYATTIPGKKVRQNLLKVLGHWITVPEDKAIIIENIMHTFHNGTLLLDDIQDGSLLRRGVPAAYTVYGIPKTLFAFNWTLGETTEMIHQLNSTELMRTYMKTLLEIVAGQGMELYWRDNHICPTEAEYLQMIYRKTGLIFLLAEETMNTFSTGKKAEVGKMLTALGMYFQINDDYQNLRNQFYFDSKGFCEDITEGKYSYPIIHAINNFPKEGAIIRDILRKRTYDVELKRKCLAILEKCGSFEYTSKKLIELKGVIYSEIAKLDENPLFDEFIQTAMVVCL